MREQFSAPEHQVPGRFALPRQPGRPLKRVEIHRVKIKTDKEYQRNNRADDRDRHGSLDRRAAPRVARVQSGKAIGKAIIVCFDQTASQAQRPASVVAVVDRFSRVSIQHADAKQPSAGASE